MPGQTSEIAIRIANAQPFLIFGGAATLVLLESWRPTGLARPWRLRWRHVVRNLVLWILTIALFNVTLGASYTPIIPQLEFGRVGALYFLDLPFWLHALVALLLYDLADYLIHRLSHEVRWLWLLHATHHTDDAMDLSTSVRAHPLHFAVVLFWKMLAVAAIGVPFWVVLLRETLAIPVVQLHHAAVRWPAWLERWLRFLVVTPAMHRVHHSPQPRETNSNYASLFPWWDRLLGTYVAPPGADSERLPGFGLDGARQDSWQSVRGMLLTPWLARNRTL